MFGKICQLRLKERLYISNLAKFESDLLKTNQDIASSSFTDVYMVGGGGGAPTPPHHQPSKLL